MMARLCGGTTSPCYHLLLAALCLSSRLAAAFDLETDDLEENRGRTSRHIAVLKIGKISRKQAAFDFLLVLKPVIHIKTST
jgi:hypothetical protein